jgi:hypothetical protein
MTVQEMIAEHEAHARMFEGSGKSLRPFSPAAAEAAFRMSQQHRDLAEMLRGEVRKRGEQRELRTAEALRKRGRV